MKTKSTKQQEAQERQAYWASLTPEEQLADLDRRLGTNKGAAKQRAKIKELINEV